MGSSVIVVGLFAGLLTALGHSLAYLATRWYTAERGRSTAQLLVLAHTMMGLLVGAALPLAWPSGLAVEAGWAWPIPVAVVTFLIGQICLLSALRTVDASRVAPLLGLKVAMLAVVASVMGTPLGVLQWLGVGLAVLSAWLLNGLGGRLPWRAGGLVLLACVAYAACDTSIVAIITGIRDADAAEVNPFHASIFTVCCMYASCGLVAFALLPVWGSRDGQAWRDALPFTAAWLGAMVALYASFALVGLVLTAILQSTRGVISIALGAGIAWLGHHHLESQAPPGLVARRVAVAGLMTAAVALYVWGG